MFLDLPAYIAETTEPASGIGAFNINLKSFLFQLLTFVIVLLILRKWVFPRLVATIDGRRRTLEEGLAKAKEAEESLAKAEARAEELLQSARRQADQALAEAAAQAKEVIAKAEEAADEQAKRLLDEAEVRLGQEKLKLHEELKHELASIVALATERVLREKIDRRRDHRLIEESLKELVK